MYIFLRILLFIWCLPQNIVGFIFVKIKKGTMYIFAPDAGTYSTKNIFIKFVRWIRTKLLVNEYYYIEDKKGVKNYGVSLGNYICMCCENITGYNNKDVQHENGHRVQSVIFGPFYFAFVGITSLINFAYHRIILSKKYDKQTLHKKYHDFFVESWADKLGSC